MCDSNYPEVDNLGMAYFLLVAFVYVFQIRHDYYMPVFMALAKQTGQDRRIKQYVFGESKTRIYKEE